MTDRAGKVIISYEYDAFGNITRRQGSLENAPGYLFQTKEADEESGLIYFGARYYDPQLGRWLTPDPMGMIDGPNTYLYCSNNPVGFIDPWGLCGKKKEKQWWERFYPNAGIKPGDPLPPGWNESWKRLPPSRPSESGEHWYDLNGGEWHWHPKDKYHPNHWDYKPSDMPNSQWQRIPAESPPPVSVPWWKKIPFISDPVIIIIDPCLSDPCAPWCGGHEDNPA